MTSSSSWCSTERSPKASDGMLGGHLDGFVEIRAFEEVRPRDWSRRLDTRTGVELSLAPSHADIRGGIGILEHIPLQTHATLLHLRYPGLNLGADASAVRRTECDRLVAADQHQKRLWSSSLGCSSSTPSSQSDRPITVEAPRCSPNQRVAVIVSFRTEHLLGVVVNWPSVWSDR
jgi:hypothetical protein